MGREEPIRVEPGCRSVVVTGLGMAFCPEQAVVEEGKADG